MKTNKKELLALTVAHRGGKGSTSFTGRDNGEQVREALTLDKLDGDDRLYNISIPDNTTSFNPSFFLGLFYPSIKKLGSIVEFKLKYNIDLSNFKNRVLASCIMGNIAESERKAVNELNGETGLG